MLPAVQGHRRSRARARCLRSAPAGRGTAQAGGDPAVGRRSATWHSTSREPLVSFSRALHLTTPRHELQVAIGRGHEDRIDTQVHLTLPPPAGPLPARQPPKQRRPVVAKPLFTAAHPLRVWVAGDSLAQVPGDALERVGGAARRRRCREPTLDRARAHRSLQLVHAHPAGAEAAAAAGSPSSRSAPTTRTTTWAARTSGPFGSPSWSAEYRRRVDGVTRELNAEGIYVVWLGLPIPDGPGLQAELPGRQPDPRGGREGAPEAVDVRRHVAPARRLPRPLHGVPARPREADADAAPRRRALHRGGRRPDRARRS